MDTSRNINGFIANYKVKTFANTKMFIISSILNLLGAPLFVLSALLQVYYDEKERLANLMNPNSYHSYVDFEIYMVISVFAMMIFCVVVMVTTFNTYHYLYNKPMVDVVYSLPITTKQRFFSDYLAGLTTFMLPYVVSIIISLIINGIGKSVCHKWANEEYNTLANFLIIALIGFLTLLMLYTTIVLVLTFCGSIVEGIGYTFIFNALIPIVTAITVFFIEGTSFGLDSEEIIIKVIQNISVGGGLITLVNAMDYYDSTLATPEMFIWIFIYLLVTAILFGCAYFLYNKRKAEDISKPIVFKPVYYVLMTFICYCFAVGITISSLSFSVFEAFPWIMCGSIVFFILDSVTNRGFKKFGIGIVKYLGMTAGSIALLLILANSDAFGASQRIPNAKNIKEIRLENRIDPFGISNYYQPITFDSEDTEEIEIILESHQSIIDDYKAYLDTKPSLGEKISYEIDGSYQSVGYEYDLKAGSSFARYYSRVNYDTVATLSKLYLSDKNIQIISDELFARVDYRYEEDEQAKFISDFIYDKYQNELNYSISVNDYKRLVDAYVTDLKSATIEELTNEAITIGFISRVNPIFSSYKNTLALLKEFDINLSPDNYFFISNGMGVDISLDGSFLAEENEVDFIATNMNFNFYNGNPNNSYTVTINYKNIEQMEKLLEIAEPYYYTKDINSPVFNFEGTNYIVPIEYKELAKEFIDNSYDKETFEQRIYREEHSYY